MNPSTFGDAFNIAGGSGNILAEAVIQAVSGSVNFGATASTGTILGFILGRTDSIAPTRILMNSGDSSIFALGTMTMQGGAASAGANPRVEYSNVSGAININTPTLNVLGGSGNNAFAMLSTVTGNITINITGTGDIDVTGGSGTGAFAQIGKGDLDGATAPKITSDIIFTSIGNNINITGGSGTNAYAQIGHSPYNAPSSVEVVSDITFPPSGTLQLNLTGDGPSATAILGHGNEQAARLSTCSGDLKIVAKLGVALTGGANDYSHAVIGFACPTLSSSATFNATSNLLQLDRSTGSAVITLTGGTGSNAVIGCYNENPVAVNSISIEQIDVKPGNGVLTLQAGNQNNNNSGVAAIGTFLGNGSTSESDIQITSSNDVHLLGPTSGNSGSARILNNLTTVLTPSSRTRNITISAKDLLLLGGVGTTAGFSQIYSSRDLNLTLTGNFYVNHDASGSVLQEGFAEVIGANSVSLTSSLLTRLTGGSQAVAYALVSSTQGTMLIGDANSSGTNALIIGKTDSQAYSRVYSNSGNAFINVGGNITLQGGTGTGTPPPSAEISGLNGTMTVKGTGALLLTAGSGTLGFAQIAYTNGDMNFSILGGNVSLNGGTGSNAYAQIGKGEFSSGGTSITSNITFNQVLGNVLLQGGLRQPEPMHRLVILHLMEALPILLLLLVI